ncbi:MAG: Cdc6/Cdc18 family protein, partial [Nanopusillaceae archaeon]
MTTNSIIDYFLSDFNKYIDKKSKIIKDSRYFNEEYIPEDIKFRDTQKEMIFFNIGQFIKFGMGSNMFLYGSTGTGKTTLVKILNNGLNTISIRNKIKLKVAYVNCKFISSKDTDYYLFKRIYESITNTFVKTGERKQELIERVFRFVSENDNKLLIILDEADHILNRENISELLYILLRNSDNNIKLIFVSNNITFVNSIDPRVRSSLSSMYFVNFPPYDYYQLKEILKDRAEKALVPSSISEEGINFIAARVAKTSGDARVAINILKLSAMIVSAKGKEKIEIEDIKEAFENIDLDIIKSVVYQLNRNQKIILFSLISRQLKSDNDYVTFSELYEEYVKNMEKLGLEPLDRTTVYKNLKTI